LENPQTNQKEKMMRTRCTNKCPGKPEPGETTQTFARRGSPVKVTIRMIPAAVCPLCHESYLSRETAEQIDRLLEPFHGKHGFIPALPPAEVTIDFALATTMLKAA
jgi:YgiT-type zinc finger domain-containing protein